MLHKVYSNLNHCLFSVLSSASARVRHTRALAAAHHAQFEGCFRPTLTRVRNDLPYTVFDTGTLNGFNEAVNRWLLNSPSLFFSVSVVQMLVGLRKHFINNFVFQLGPVPRPSTAPGLGVDEVESD